MPKDDKKRFQKLASLVVKEQKGDISDAGATDEEGGCDKASSLKGDSAMDGAEAEKLCFQWHQRCKLETSAGLGKGAFATVYHAATCLFQRRWI